jgi:flavin reductase (DIM6/NTAB) family NADH-FMN oxidoreductase RutF
MKKSLGPKPIVYPAPVLVIGTYDNIGVPNVMTASWAGICCSTPPCVSVSLRKATYTYGSIIDRKAFTVNIPSEMYAKHADYFGMTSGRKENKFSATGLTPVKSQLVDAPYVEEFPLVLECTLLHSLEVGSHTMFVGEILDVKIDEAASGEKYLADIRKVRPIMYSPESKAYFGVGSFVGQAFSMGKDLGK